MAVAPWIVSDGGRRYRVFEPHASEHDVAQRPEQERLLQDNAAGDDSYESDSSRPTAAELMCRARSLVPLDHRRGRDFQSLHRGPWAAAHQSP